MHLPYSFNTIKTIHTTAVVYLVIVYVDAGRLAFLLAGMAFLALLRVDERTQQGAVASQRARLYLAVVGCQQLLVAWVINVAA